MLELAVIVPTLNERENVKPLIDRLEESLAGIEWEVIFVDDDSPDATAELCRQIGRSDRRVRSLQRIGRRGLASACLEGILATCAPYVAIIDGDLQHDEKLLPGMLERLKAENLDLVIGSRNVEGGSMGRMADGRVRLSNLGRAISQRVISSELQDPMSGFFVADRRFINIALPRVSAVGFKILLDLIASSPRPVRLAEVPYEFKSRARGESKLDTTVAFEYLTLVLHKLIGSILPVQFVMFGLVGLVGAFVHLVVLSVLLSRWGISFQGAHAMGTLVAMSTNFFLNNLITYRDRRLRGWRLLPGMVLFFEVCALGALSNFALAKLLYSSGWPWYPAGAMGMGVSSVWNFSVTSALSWRGCAIGRSAAQWSSAGNRWPHNEAAAPLRAVLSGYRRSRLPCARDSFVLFDGWCRQHARRWRYRLAHPRGRMDPRPPPVSHFRFLFIYEIRPTMVCLGVALGNFRRVAIPPVRDAWRDPGKSRNSLPHIDEPVAPGPPAD